MGAVAMSAEAQRSRLSYTNSTTAEIRRQKPSRSNRLTDRDGVSLRTDVRDFGRLDDRPVDWITAAEKLINYDEEARETEIRFENTETGDIATSPVSHRFQPEYRERQFARFHDLVRAAQERWPVVHTTLIGLTASSTPGDEQQAPVDHWQDCDHSNDAVKQAIRRIKNEYGAVAIEFVEAHPGGGTNDGYLHKHPVILSGQHIPDAELQKVLNAHVNNAPNARHDAHSLDQSVTRSRLSGRQDSEKATNEVINNLPAYLTGYLLDYGQRLEELPESQLAGAAVMWADGTQSVRPGAEAQQMMKLDPDDDAEESPWTIAGVERDGEFIPADDTASGGVDRFTTGGLDPPDPVD
jgi:hypothetical protein